VAATSSGRRQHLRQLLEVAERRPGSLGRADMRKKAKTRHHGLGAAELASHSRGMHGRLSCGGSRQRPHADQLPQAQVRRHLCRRRLHVRTAALGWPRWPRRVCTPGSSLWCRPTSCTGTSPSAASTILRPTHHGGKRFLIAGVSCHSSGHGEQLARRTTLLVSNHANLWRTSGYLRNKMDKSVLHCYLSGLVGQLRFAPWSNHAHL
jgi:hypothetical protein